MTSFTEWLSQTSISLVIQTHEWIIPTIQSIHIVAIGLVLVSVFMIDLRILGVARRVPLPALAKFYPILWAALAANFVSGVLLFIGYPYKAFTNPVFYLKLSFIAFGIFLMVNIKNEVLLVFHEDQARENPLWRRARRLAVASLICWAGAITAGRLLAYTFFWLRVGIPGGF